MYTVIDPELPAKLTDVAVVNAEEMMRSFGAPEDQIDTQMDQVREDTAGRFTVSGSLTGFAWGFLIYAIVCAITSLIVRKNEPEMM